ncbi:hypothetical protein HK405_014661, partial [Cladochytrium tenue]
MQPPPSVSSSSQSSSTLISTPWTPTATNSEASTRSAPSTHESEQALPSLEDARRLLDDIDVRFWLEFSSLTLAFPGFTMGPARFQVCLLYDRLFSDGLLAGDELVVDLGSRDRSDNRPGIEFVVSPLPSADAARLASRNALSLLPISWRLDPESGTGVPMEYAVIVVGSEDHEAYMRLMADPSLPVFLERYIKILVAHRCEVLFGIKMQLPARSAAESSYNAVEEASIPETREIVWRYGSEKKAGEPSGSVDLGGPSGGFEQGPPQWNPDDFYGSLPPNYSGAFARLHFFHNLYGHYLRHYNRKAGLGATPIPRKRRGSHSSHSTTDSTVTTSESSRDSHRISRVRSAQHWNPWSGRHGWIQTPEQAAFVEQWTYWRDRFAAARGAYLRRPSSRGDDLQAAGPHIGTRDAGAVWQPDRGDGRPIELYRSCMWGMLVLRDFPANRLYSKRVSISLAVALSLLDLGSGRLDRGETLISLLMFASTFELYVPEGVEVRVNLGGKFA